MKIDWINLSDRSTNNKYEYICKLICVKLIFELKLYIAYMFFNKNIILLLIKYIYITLRKFRNILI